MEPLMVEAPEEGKATVFSYRDAIGMISEGFVIQRDGQYFAYRNQCRHQPLSLDYGDGDFFTQDGAYLLCRNHAALFEPKSGLCISGPCIHAKLFSFPVEQAGDKIRVNIEHETGLLELQ